MTQVGSRISKHLQKTFSIDHVSMIDDQRYTGTFVVKKLTLRELAALGTRKAQLNAGMHYSETSPGQGVDPQTDELNGMIAHLELAIVDAPKWWKLDEFADAELFNKIYQEVISFENSFHRRRQPALQSGADDSSGAEGSEGPYSNPLTSGDGGAVVPSEVQSALEP